MPYLNARTLHPNKISRKKRKKSAATYLPLTHPLILHLHIRSIPLHLLRLFPRRQPSLVDIRLTTPPPLHRIPTSGNAQTRALRRRGPLAARVGTGLGLTITTRLSDPVLRLGIVLASGSSRPSAAAFIGLFGSLARFVGRFRRCGGR